MRTERERLDDFTNAVSIAAGALAGAVLLGEQLGFTPSRVVSEIQEQSAALGDRYSFAHQEQLPFGGDFREE